MLATQMAVMLYTLGSGRTVGSWLLSSHPSHSLLFLPVISQLRDPTHRLNLLEGRELLGATFFLHPSSAASYDKRIILWDIGVPDHEYKFQAR